MRTLRHFLPLLAILVTGSLARPHLMDDPSRPRDLEATADGPYAVDLDWRSSKGADGYYIYRDGDRVGESDRSEYRDEGLEPATTYVYRVSALDDDGDESDLSDPVEVTTETRPRPTTPADLVATAVGPYRIDLLWSASEAESGIAYYRVFRGGVEAGTTGDTDYQDTGLDPETTYEYRVSAVDDEGSESDLSEPASATTHAAPGPPPPANVTAIATGSTQVTVAWTPPSDPGQDVAGYNVYRDGEFVGFVVATSFADSGLVPGTTYGYTVASVNGEGIEGQRSEEVTVTTPPSADTVPPAPPTGLRLAGSG